MKGSLVLPALWLSALGSAVVGGVFFAFSTFVMTALRSLPPAQGLAAMQTINRSVLDSLFLALFMVSTMAAVFVAVAAVVQRGPGALPAIAGAGLWVVGSFAVTAAINVPLNDALAPLDPAQAGTAGPWADYVRTWTAWNHVRTAASLLAFVGFMLALQAAGKAEATP